MSGGFFRGTSAEQDTRFSNKQAKLLKTQKFAPELEHPVDTRKVKMDVIKPWIANRVTELLGFEDEVLINFIYGLLDGEGVNGKQVQISITGFMEKNAGKFMKELWTLLLSAQNNGSGVPQQFLDAKEEEMRKKQAEVDRITNEIQKKKEKDGREFERDRLKKMDGGLETKDNNATMEPASKQTLPKDSSGHPEDEQEIDRSNGVRGRTRVSRSPPLADHSPSFHRGSPSHVSKSFSKLRSYSGQKSRSVSRSPEAHGVMLHQRHSLGVSVSPTGRRSSHTRRSSRSPFPHRSTSPMQRRSPSPSRRRRSPSPSRRRRSPSPSRRRRSPSPVRHSRSPSPVRHSRSPSLVRRPISPSPVRRPRSPSPVRRRRSPSPVRRRRSPSPVRRRRSPSPVRRRRSPFSIRHRRSPSPIRRRRSPSSVRRRRSPSPIRRRKSPSPMRRRSPLLVRRRSPSPMRRRSPSPARRRSPLPMRRKSPSAMYHRSPSSLQHRSSSPEWSRSPPPMQHGSPSPFLKRYRRPPSTPRHRSPVRRRSPIASRRRSPAPSLRRSSSPYGSSSPSPFQTRSLSPIKRNFANEHRRSPVESRVGVRTGENLSLVPRMLSNSLRSQKRDLKDQKFFRNKEPAVSSSPEKFPIRSESPPLTRNRSATSEDGSPYESPVRQQRAQITYDGSLGPPQKPRVQKPSHGSPETSMEDEETDLAREGGDYKSMSSLKLSMHSSTISKQQDSPVKVRYSPERSAVRRAVESQNRADNVESRKKDQELRGEKSSGRRVHSESPIGQRPPTLYKYPLQGDRSGQKSDERSRLRLNNVKESEGCSKSEAAAILVGKVDHHNGGDAFDSVSGESGKEKTKDREKRKHKRSHRHEVDSDADYSNDSEIETRKEAKRRRREEKKLRKEEKRRRREERRRRRDERRAGKLKSKDRFDDVSADDEHVGRKESRPSDDEETQSDQKKLEIELRKKALESLKAKKGIGH